MRNNNNNNLLFTKKNNQPNIMHINQPIVLDQSTNTFSNLIPREATTDPKLIEINNNQRRFKTNEFSNLSEIL